MAKLNCTTGNISGLEFMNETSLNIRRNWPTEKSLKDRANTLSTTLKCHNETQGEECKSNANA